MEHQWSIVKDGTTIDWESVDFESVDDDDYLHALD